MALSSNRPGNRILNPEIRVRSPEASPFFRRLLVLVNAAWLKRHQTSPRGGSGRRIRLRPGTLQVRILPGIPTYLRSRIGVCDGLRIRVFCGFDSHRRYQMRLWQNRQMRRV